MAKKKTTTKTAAPRDPEPSRTAPSAASALVSGPGVEPTPQPSAPAPDPGRGGTAAGIAPRAGDYEITPQGEDADLYLARYTWEGVEHAHNVRRSSLLRKIEEHRQTLQQAQGDEWARVEGLRRRHEYLLSLLPAGQPLTT